MKSEHLNLYLFMPYCVPDSEANCIHHKRFISVAECLEYSIFASILKSNLNTQTFKQFKFMNY